MCTYKPEHREHASAGVKAEVCGGFWPEPSPVAHWLARHVPLVASPVKLTHNTSKTVPCESQSDTFEFEHNVDVATPN